MTAATVRRLDLRVDVEAQRDSIQGPPGRAKSPGIRVSKAISVMDECALCGENRRLLESHTIPKFVVEWLKESSATGRLRQVINWNKPSQDVPRRRILCQRCEERFSRWEKQFAENVFYPVRRREEDIEGLQYDDWLLKFALSISWRGFVASRRPENAARASPWEKTVKRWGAYLLDRADDPGPQAHHMFFLAPIVGTHGMDIPERWHFYTLRAIDQTLACSSTEAFMYTNLAGLVICSWLEPADPPGWTNTRIHPAGTIVGPCCIDHPGFGEFLLDRIREVNKIKAPLSDRQRSKVVRRLRENPRRAAESESLAAVLLDQQWATKVPGEGDGES